MYTLCIMYICINIYICSYKFLSAIMRQAVYQVCYFQCIYICFFILTVIIILILHEETKA